MLCFPLDCFPPCQSHGVVSEDYILLNIMFFCNKKRPHFCRPTSLVTKDLIAISRAVCPPLYLTKYLFWLLFWLLFIFRSPEKPLKSRFLEIRSRVRFPSAALFFILNTIINKKDPTELALSGNSVGFLYSLFFRCLFCFFFCLISCSFLCFRFRLFFLSWRFFCIFFCLFGNFYSLRCGFVPVLEDFFLFFFFFLLVLFNIIEIIEVIFKIVFTYRFSGYNRCNSSCCCRGKSSYCNQSPVFIDLCHNWSPFLFRCF